MSDLSDREHKYFAQIRGDAEKAFSERVCLPATTIWALAFDEATDSGVLSLSESDSDHLKQCEACRQKVSEARTALRQRMAVEVKEIAKSSTIAEGGGLPTADTDLVRGDNERSIDDVDDDASKTDPSTELATPAYEETVLGDRERIYLELKRESISLLGSGGFSMVWKTQLKGQLVALKELEDPPLKEAIDRFPREIAALDLVTSPHVVKKIMHGTRAGLPYLVLECIDGLTLEKLLDARERISVADACELCRQVAVGLTAIDEQGLVHRDIKLTNVMIDRNGCVKIIDFGLAKSPKGMQRDAELTRQGQTMGTKGYTSREMIEDPAAADIRSDIYSLGCTLFRLLTGELPGGYDRNSSTLFSQFRDDIPAELQATIRRLIAPNASDRLQTPAEVANALAPYCRDADPRSLLPPLNDANEHSDLSAGSQVSRPDSDASRETPSKEIEPRAGSRSTWLAAVALILMSLALILLAWSIMTNSGFVRSPSENSGDKTGPAVEKLFTEIHGHQGAVWAVSFSPNGRYFATGDSQGTVRIFETDTLQPPVFVAEKFRPHQEKIWCLEFSPSGTAIATGAEDGFVQVYDVESGEKLLSIGPLKRIHVVVDGKRSMIPCAIKDVSFSRDGKWLATATGYSVDLWDAKTGDHVKKLATEATKPGDEVVFGPDGNWLAYTAIQETDTGRVFWTIEVWDAQTAEFHKSFTADGSQIYDLDLGPNGALAVGTRDGRVRTWDVDTGKELEPINVHSGSVWSVNFSADGGWMATTGADFLVRLWPVGAPGEVQSLEPHPTWVRDLSFHPRNRRKFISTDEGGGVRFWSLSESR